MQTNVEHMRDYSIEISTEGGLLHNVEELRYMEPGCIVNADCSADVLELIREEKGQ
jgi:hypothetical protein